MNIDYVHTYLTAYSRKFAKEQVNDAAAIARAPRPRATPPSRPLSENAPGLISIGAGGGGAFGALMGAALAKKGRRLRGAAIGGGIGAGVGAGAGYGYSRYAANKAHRTMQRDATQYADEAEDIARAGGYTGEGDAYSAELEAMGRRATASQQRRDAAAAKANAEEMARNADRDRLHAKIDASRTPPGGRK